MASDGITIVTNANADVGLTDITLKQLAAVWGPKSKINNWGQILPPGTFNDVPSPWPARARSRAPTTSSTRRSWVRTRRAR